MRVIAATVFNVLLLGQPVYASFRAYSKQTSVEVYEKS